MGNTLLPNNPTLDEIKDLIRRINSRIKIINASVNQEELTIDSPIATIIQSNSTDPGEYTTTDIDTTNFYTKNEINTLLQGKVNSTDLNTLLDGKQDTIIPDTTPTASSANLVTSGGVKSYVDSHDDFKITGTVSNSGYTLTDSRINDEHWEVDWIQFTNFHVTPVVNWSTNIVNHTVTLSATYNENTNVVVNMHWVQ